MPRTPMNHGAKFDATSFILGREICNRTNTLKTNKKTVTDISTPRLLACVDKKQIMLDNLGPVIPNVKLTKL